MTVTLSPGVLVLANTASEREWLAARKQGIGASEIAAAVGLSRRRGPWDVWSSKVDGTEWEPTDEMRWGQFIESRIVDWWANETGRHVGQGGLYRHPQHQWLIATPDAVVIERQAPADDSNYRSPLNGLPVAGPRVVTATVDAKNAGWHMAGDWEDDGAPLEYICQITHQMLAVGVSTGYLVAAIGGKPPVERRFDLDLELAGELIARGAQMWRLIEERTPPPLDGSMSATRWLKARYPDADPDSFTELDGADVDRLTEWVGLDERIRALETIRREVENAIKEKLGPSIEGIHNGRTYVTWRQINRAGYEVAPTSFRKFTIPKRIREELTPHG